MGAVYQATQLSLTRTVALKVLSADIGDDPSFRQRFRREGQLQATLDHPHIVTVYEAGDTEHGLFLAMRLVKGPTLKELIHAGTLDTDRSLAILRSVADALDSAHGADLIHRDVKPQNILIGARDHAYLADFGLTKAVGVGRLTETGQFLGTIDYVAPEQVQGEDAGGRSDVYSLTGVLYECLSGATPFQKTTEAAVLYAHISEPPPRLSEARPEFPEAIDAVIARGMAKRPEDRYATATELVRDAAAALGKSQIPVETPDRQGRTGAAGAPTAASRQPGGATVPARTAGLVKGDPTAPARTAPTAERRGLPFAVVAVAAATALAAVGFLVGSAGSEDQGGVEFPNSASAGSLALSFPPAWERLFEVPRVPGLDMSDPIVLGRGSGRQAQLAAGLVQATGRTLLPASFIRTLPEGVPTARPVRLGSFDAYRYAGLRPLNLGREVTVYATPTTGGVATIACSATGGEATNALTECEAVATTLELSGVKALPLGPSEDYAARLGTAFERLGSARRSAEGELREADTQEAQAAAAVRLADAYAAAARTLARAQVSPADGAVHNQTVSALRGIATAYRNASSAARGGNGAGFAAAEARIRGDGRRLERALFGLEDLGYSAR